MAISYLLDEGDSAGGHLTAALSLRWRREMIEPQRKRASNSSAATSSAAAELLPPIRLQVLIYPLVQFVNTSTTSFTAHSDFLYGRSPLLRAWTWVTFPDRINDRALVRALTASSHVTRTTRERLAHYFHFGPPDGSEDEVHISPFTFEFRSSLMFGSNPIPTLVSRAFHSHRMLHFSTRVQPCDLNIWWAYSVLCFISLGTMYTLSP